MRQSGGSPEFPAMMAATSRRPQVTSPRHALRERTAGTHAALDLRIGPLDTLDRYARYLRGMHAFRAPLEEALAGTALPGWFAGWRPLALGPALTADLADLGLGAGVPAAAAPPGVEESSTLLGVLYVLEGSALGARLLIRQARALGLSAQHGARHLALQTADTRSWRAFLALLERHPAIDLERAVGAATATFALAHDAFAKQR